jgi:predicted nucleic acid-binding protein
LSERAKQPIESYVEQFAFFDIRIDATIPDMKAIAELSLQCGASAYDASYLKICQKHKLPLATLDERLKPCAQRADVKIYTLN